MFSVYKSITSWSVFMAILYATGEGNGNPLRYSCPWRIPWTEEPGGLLFIGSQRIGHDWVSKHNMPLHSQTEALSLCLLLWSTLAAYIPRLAKGYCCLFCLIRNCCYRLLSNFLKPPHLYVTQILEKNTVFMRFKKASFCWWNGKPSKSLPVFVFFKWSKYTISISENSDV